MLGQRIDLLLGGDLGLWALNQVAPDNIGQVLTFDVEIMAKARSLGLSAEIGDANKIVDKTADVGLSVHYPMLIRSHVLTKYRKLYNLHPGYLPWGRGFYPVFWALWERTPAGATLHEMSQRVDEGPIVAQIQVEYYPHDTGGSLHRRVREAEERLFLEFWPRLVRGEDIPSKPQRGKGSFHYRKEFFALKRQPEWEKMTAAQLLHLVRCLSFPGYTGLELSLDGRPFELSLTAINSLPEGKVQIREVKS